MCSSTPGMPNVLLRAPTPTTSTSYGTVWFSASITPPALVRRVGDVTLTVPAAAFTAVASPRV